MRNWRQIVLLLVLPALFCFSCKRNGDPVPAEVVQENPAKPYFKEFSAGPLFVRLRLDRTVLRLDENIILSLEVEAPEEYVVDLPALDSGVVHFIKWDLLKSYESKLTEKGTMLYGREMQLEPLMSTEKLSIQPMKCKFRESAKDKPDAKEYEVETEEVALDVTMPPEEYWETLAVDTALSSEPVTRLVPKGSTAWVWYSAGGVLILLVALCCVFFRRKKIEAIAPPPPPHVVALNALHALVADDLIEKGDTMGFYNRIQDILRNYIEGRFDIHAPERTTEEFMEELRNMADSPVVQYQKLLETFLRHCDLVRFAAHIPEKDEIQATFNACRDFIVGSSGVENN